MADALHRTLVLIETPAGCMIKIFQWKQDLLILIDVMLDSFKIDGGMWNGKQKSNLTVTDITWRTATLTKWKRHKHSGWVSIRIEQNIVSGCTIENVGPSYPHVLSQ